MSHRGHRRPLRRWMTQSPVMLVTLTTSRKPLSPSKFVMSDLTPVTSSAMRCLDHGIMSLSSQCQEPTFLPSSLSCTIHRGSPLPTSAPPRSRSDGHGRAALPMHGRGYREHGRRGGAGIMGDEGEREEEGGEKREEEGETAHDSSSSSSSSGGAAMRRCRRSMFARMF
eukprot:758412-Hanusia_phi.AAC.3